MQDSVQINEAVIIKSLIRAAERFLKTAKINCEEAAMASPHMYSFADEYPSLHTLGLELQHFYGFKLGLGEEMPGTYLDSAAAFWKLSTAISNELPNHYILQKSHALLENSNQRPSQDIRAAASFIRKNWKDSGNSRYETWFHAAMALEKLRLEEKDAQNREQIEREIGCSPLTDEIMRLFGNGIPEALDGVRQIELSDILSDTAVKLADKYRSPEIKDIKSRLQRQLIKNKFLSRNEPLILKDNNLLSYAEIIDNHRPTRLKLRLLCSDLRSGLEKLPYSAVHKTVAAKIIARKKMAYLNSVEDSRYFNAGEYIPYKIGQAPEASLPQPETIKLEPEFDAYAVERKLPRPLARDFKQLLNFWVSEEEDRLYITEQNISRLRYANNGEDIANRAETEEDLAIRLQNLIKATEAMREFRGINLNEPGLSSGHLRAMRESRIPLNNRQLDIIDNFIDSFAGNFDITPEEFAHPDPLRISSQYVKNLDKLPDTRQKYRLAHYSGLALSVREEVLLSEVFRFEREAAKKLKISHSAVLAPMQEYLNDYFRQKRDGTRIGAEMDDALTKNFILPLYLPADMTSDGRNTDQIISGLASLKGSSTDDRQFVSSVAKHHLKSLYRFHNAHINKQNFDLSDELSLTLYGLVSSRNELHQTQKLIGELHPVYVKQQKLYQSYMNKKAGQQKISKTNFNLDLYAAARNTRN